MSHAETKQLLDAPGNGIVLRSADRTVLGPHGATYQYGRRAPADMGAALAHELNQPLTAIGAYAAACERQFSADAPDLEKMREMLAGIRDQLRRAGEIVGRARELATGRAIYRAGLDLNQLVRDVARLLEIDAHTHGAAIDFDLAPDLPPVPGERIQLEQVLVNLVKNAIEAMRASKEERRVCITTRRLPGRQVHIGVRDRGSGIPPALVEKVFQPYFTTKPDGMGLGLAISQSIIDAHRGRLWVNAGAEDGAEFLITLLSEEEGSNEIWQERGMRRG